MTMVQTTDSDNRGAVVFYCVHLGWPWKQRLVRQIHSTVLRPVFIAAQCATLCVWSVSVCVGGARLLS